MYLLHLEMLLNLEVTGILVGGGLVLIFLSLAESYIIIVP